MVKDAVSLPPRFTFKKEERLSSKKLIDELFKSGSSFYLQPFRVQWLYPSSPLKFTAQILAAVSAKNFPNAVDRNRVKRLIREAYRLNKHALINKLEKDKGQLLIAFIYTGKKMESFEVINEKMIAILKRFEQKHGAITKNS